MYIPATVADVSKVLVDVGTGYFVEKAIPTAQTYVQGRMDMIVENLRKLEAALARKRSDLRTVEYVMQQKALTQQQDQQTVEANKTKVIAT